MFARTKSLVLVFLSLSLGMSCVKVDKSTAKAEAPAEKLAPAETPAIADETAKPHVETVKPVAEATASTQTSQIDNLVAQAAQTKSAAQPSAPQPAAKQPAATDRPPTKQEILHSPEWRRAMFEFSEWLTAQTIYTPAQVAQIKDQFNHRVAAMDARELAYMLNDMEAKFHIMSTPEAREARAWMAQYLSVLSDRKRAELLKDVPNIATMTAAQLNAEIQKIVEKRQTLESEQSAFQRGQAAQVANQIRTDRTNQQTFVRGWNSAPMTYSPYRSGAGSNVNERLNNAPIGADMGFYVGPFGGVGLSFAPSSW